MKITTIRIMGGKYLRCVYVKPKKKKKLHESERGKIVLKLKKNL